MALPAADSTADIAEYLSQTKTIYRPWAQARGLFLCRKEKFGKSICAAAGHDRALPLYDPFVNLLGIDSVRRELASQSELSCGRISSQLVGVTPTDVWTAALAVALLGFTALISVLAPVGRASAIDAVAALRYE